jgi:hypothetical protein
MKDGRIEKKAHDRTPFDRITDLLFVELSGGNFR